jgi:hypothetical protein
MDVPREDQLVRMSPSGKPVPGQLSVARLRGTAAGAKMAQAVAVRKVSSPSTRRKPVKNGRRR